MSVKISKYTVDPNSSITITRSLAPGEGSIIMSAQAMVMSDTAYNGYYTVQLSEVRFGNNAYQSLPSYRDPVSFEFEVQGLLEYPFPDPPEGYYYEGFDEEGNKPSKTGEFFEIKATLADIEAEPYVDLYGNTWDRPTGNQLASYVYANLDLVTTQTYYLAAFEDDTVPVDDPNDPTPGNIDDLPMPTDGGAIGSGLHAQDLELTSAGTLRDIAANTIILLQDVLSAGLKTLDFAFDRVLRPIVEGGIEIASAVLETLREVPGVDFAFTWVGTNFESAFTTLTQEVSTRVREEISKSGQEAEKARADRLKAIEDALGGRAAPDAPALTPAQLEALENERARIIDTIKGDIGTTGVRGVARYDDGIPAQELAAAGFLSGQIAPAGILAARIANSGLVDVETLFSKVVGGQVSLGGDRVVAIGTDLDENIVLESGTRGQLQLAGGNDRAKGAGAGDAISGGNGSDIIKGGGGRDRLDGDAGNDRLVGGSGNDRTLGGDGDDRLLGGGGNDRLVGGSGTDVAKGGSGDDVLIGGAGNDRLVGGDGKDKLLGKGGDDELFGNGGRDKMLGGSGDDNLVGQAGKDRLVGGMGNDDLDGGGGNDTLIGGAGVDLVYGGDGNDRIIFDFGGDVLDGGSGADRFVLASKDIPEFFEDIPPYIYGLNEAEGDRLDLTIFGGLNGVLAFSATGQAEVRVSSDAVLFDLDGDGGVDRSIMLEFSDAGLDALIL